MKRILAFLLSGTIFVSCAARAIMVRAEVDAETDQKLKIQTTYSEESYKNYLESNEWDLADRDIEIRLDKEVKSAVSFEVEVPEDGMYQFGMSYVATDNKVSDIEISLKIDDKVPFSNAEHLIFPRMWCDAKGEIQKDGVGNEFSKQQVKYDDFYYNVARNDSADDKNPFLFGLTKGTHTITIEPKVSEFKVAYCKFEAQKDLVAYKDLDIKAKNYQGDKIVIEGENAKIKSNYFLVGKTDSSTTNVTPNNPYHNVINYIGGGNWKEEGSELVFETPEVKEGFYKIGFSFRQNYLIGGKSYRKLKIDGEVPFSEANTIGFSYDDNWQSMVFTNEKEEPYLIYLTEGKHEISLSVISGEIEKVRTTLSEAVSQLGNLYIDITMITGETVDIYRDYNLFVQIGDMEERLLNIKSLLEQAMKKLVEITGSKSGSNYSVIKNMVEVINQMLDNKFEAHRYKNYYYTNYCSVSSVLNDLRNMPLDLDKIVLASPEEEKIFKKSSAFSQLLFSIKRFFASFVNDYSGVSGKGGDEAITIWVNWGRDQAQVLKSLVDRSFIQNTGINVNIKLVNASIVQAVLSGKGPDCILQHARSEPVNLAMRGVLYDLTQFSDCEEVLKNFREGAELPYRYKDGLYALPDTQNFFVLFYRKDILEQFGLQVPITWDDFRLTAKLLMRNNMSAYLPNNVATDQSQVNAGVGSNNIFPSLLLQKNISLYSEDGKSTNLLSAEVMETFEEWIDYYKSLKFPKTLDFYNRFRTGTTPMGIAPYTMYTTFKIAAPELDGLWSFTAIPGTEDSNGNIRRTSAGSGTGCAILKTAKSPEKAWEFLKWWTSTETQLSYSNDVESILGPAGRVALANVEAIKEFSWDDNMLDELLFAWDQVEEIPEYPGSYYVSRSIYQSFWNVVNDNQNTKDMLMTFGDEANKEISRKWKQYSSRRK